MICDPSLDDILIAGSSRDCRPQAKATGKLQLEEGPPIAGGLANYVLYSKKLFAFFKLTRPSKAGKESFLRQILLNDLRLDT